MTTKHPVIGYIVNRIARRNKDCNAVMTGSTGSGKSWAFLECGRLIAEELGTSFTVKDNVAFSVRDLMKLTELPQNQKPGTVFMLEEAGAMGGGASSREWQSRANKFFSGWMQTKRHRNQILLVTLPYLKFLDAQARLLFHIRMSMRSIDEEHKVSHSKIYVVQVNDISEKVYIKCFRMTDKFGRTLVVRSVPWDMPPQILLNPYEIAKRKFTESYNKTIVQEKKVVVHERKITPEKIIALRDKGMKIMDMARELETDYSYLYKCTKKFGIVV